MTFNRERFLLSLLGAIFAFQAAVFVFGLVTCTRLGLGENPTDSFNETNKRAAVGRGNLTWGEFDPDKLWLETR
jgi:hypothetical protein